MKLRRKNKKGFSLMELMVAIFVSMIIIVAVVGTFAGVVKTRNIIRTSQQNLENVRGIMDLMAKTLRMSTQVVVGSGTPPTSIFFYNFSTNRCMSFRQHSSQIEVASINPINPDDLTKICGTNPPDNFSDDDYANLTSQNIEHLWFDLKQPANGLGRAAMLISVGGNDLQTTVSFRDYSQL
jgi:type II secretory pathway pseudopilin PulG